MSIKNLYICRTPFHIITSLILHHNDFKAEKADIVIFDTMNDFEKIAERIRQENIFESVYCASNNAFGNSLMMAYGVFSPRYYLKKANFKRKKYERILTNSLYGDFENALYFYNKQSEIVLFDEGYSTYTSDFLYGIRKFSKGHLLARNMSKLFLKRKYIDEMANKIYLFDPELILSKIPYNTQKIEIGILNNIIEIINRIFDVSETLKEYDAANIFFEESFSNDFNNNGDWEIIEQITKIVGKNEILIKLHPRDKTNRFGELGYKTNKSLYVPWEAIALNIVSSDKTFITFSSGATLNYRFLCENKSKTILLYKVFPEGFINMSEEKLLWFDKFVAKYGENFFVPETLQELEKELKQRK